MRRALVVHGSKRGGTAGIAAAIAKALTADGMQVDCMPASEAGDVGAYDVVVIGGALYAGRWVREARRFVSRHARQLLARPVWMFSSGPLDASAADHAIAPTRSVFALMERIGARGHATFGGRLEPTAKGFIASRMAKTHAGDWRDWEAIDHWAHGIARDVEIHPRTAPEQTSRWPFVALRAVTGIAGAILFGTILHEIVSLRAVHALQIAYLALAIATIAVAMRPVRIPRT